MSSASPHASPEDSSPETHGITEPHDAQPIPATASATATGNQNSSVARGIWIFVGLRLLFFFAPLGVFLLLGFDPWFSAIASALIGFALSLLLLQRQRDPLLQVMHQRRTGTVATKPIHGEDEQSEDQIVDDLYLGDQPKSEQSDDGQQSDRPEDSR